MSSVPFPELVSDDSHTLIKEQVTKQKIGKFADVIVNRTKDGEENALDMFMRAKITSEMAGDVMKKLKDDAMTEAGKYGKGENKMYGCDFEVTNGSTSYSYDHDEVWLKLKEQATEIAEKLKEREERMKAAFKAGGTVADDDGEVIPPAKVKGGSAPALRITIPKS